MTKQLVAPLGSYEDRDEFQVGRILVWVKYNLNRERAVQIAEAEKRLPALVEDIPAVEKLVANSMGGSCMSTVIGIHIGPDGSAEYDCTFFEGEFEDELFQVSRGSDGILIFKAQP